VLLGALLALPGAAAAHAIDHAGGYVAQQGAGSRAPASTVSDTEPLAITTHPQDVRIGFWGGVATFTVAATGADLSVRWERSSPHEEAWVLAGSEEESTDWTLAVASGNSTSLDGFRYRAVVSDGEGSVVSDPALLRIVGPLRVTEQPQDGVTAEGGTATFSTAATTASGAEGALDVQWQQSDDQGATWTDAPGASARDWTYTTPLLRLAQHGRLYRAVVQTDNGLSPEHALASRHAALTVLAVLPETVAHPVDQTVVEGGTVTFGARFGGTDAPTETAWHYSRDAGATWHPVPGAAASPYLTVDAVTLAMDGWQYRAQFSNDAGCCVVTEPATLTVEVAAPVITQHPADQTANPGGSATFATAYTGTDAETLVRWEVSTDGGATWALEGGHGLSLTLDTLDQEMHGWMYRAQLDNAVHTRWTDSATLHLVPRVAVRVTASVVRVDVLPGRA
jgi:hypothetical protein